MINSKKKGNKGENNFANWLTREGYKSGRTSGSGGGLSKGDIYNPIDFGIEVKTAKRADLPNWWRQTMRDAHLVHQRPLLAIHLDGMSEDSWLIIMDNWDWLELVKKESEPVPVLERGNLKYLSNRMVESIKAFNKELDKIL